MITREGVNMTKWDESAICNLVLLDEIMVPYNEVKGCFFQSLIMFFSFYII